MLKTRAVCSQPTHGMVGFGRLTCKEVHVARRGSSSRLDSGVALAEHPLNNRTPDTGSKSALQRKSQ